MKRIKRLLSAPTLIGVASIAIGIYVGTGFALQSQHQRLAAKYNLNDEQWERWIGVTYQTTVPAILIVTELTYLAAMLLLPVRRESDAQAVKRFARSRLAEPFITGRETQTWLGVLNYVEAAENDQ